MTQDIEADQQIVDLDRFCRSSATKVADINTAVFTKITGNENFVNGITKGIDEHPGPEFTYVIGPEDPVLILVHLYS